MSIIDDETSLTPENKVKQQPVDAYPMTATLMPYFEALINLNIQLKEQATGVLAELLTRFENDHSLRVRIVPAANTFDFGNPEIYVSIVPYFLESALPVGFILKPMWGYVARLNTETMTINWDSNQMQNIINDFDQQRIAHGLAILEASVTDEERWVSSFDYDETRDVGLIAPHKLARAMISNNLTMKINQDIFLRYSPRQLITLIHDVADRIWRHTANMKDTELFELLKKVFQLLRSADTAPSSSLNASIDTLIQQA